MRKLLLGFVALGSVAGAPARAAVPVTLTVLPPSMETVQYYEPAWREREEWRRHREFEIRREEWRRRQEWRRVHGYLPDPPPPWFGRPPPPPPGYGGPPPPPPPGYYGPRY